MIEKLTYIIPTIFVGRVDTTSIPTTVVGRQIPTKLVGTVYFDKSCNKHGQGKNANAEA